MYFKIISSRPTLFLFAYSIQSSLFISVYVFGLILYFIRTLPLFAETKINYFSKLVSLMVEKSNTLQLYVSLYCIYKVLHFLICCKLGIARVMKQFFNELGVLGYLRFSYTLQFILLLFFIVKITEYGCKHSRHFCLQISSRYFLESCKKTKFYVEKKSIKDEIPKDLNHHRDVILFFTSTNRNINQCTLGKNQGKSKGKSMLLEQGLATCFCKHQRMNMLGFESHMVSNTSTQLCLSLMVTI